MEWNSRHLVVAAVLLALVACGESKEGEQDGVPLAQVTLELGSQVHPSVVAPHVGLIWAPFMDEFEEPVYSTESMPLPASLEQMQLSVFQGPPSSIFKPNGVKLAAGMIVAFDDRDGNGSFGLYEDGIVAPDLMFGVNFFELLIYIQGPLDAELASALFVNPEAFEPGISRGRIDPCSGKLEFLPMAAPIVLETFEPTTTPMISGEYSCFE